MQAIDELPAARKELQARIRRFTFSTHREDLRALMWRLGEVVGDRDCPAGVEDECRRLYGLSGEALLRELAPLVSDLESHTARARKSRQKIEAIRLSKDLTLSDHLRDFYFGLSEDDLRAIWNDGNNELPHDERELVRIALRQRLGISASTGHVGELCPKCFLEKANCICERGWW